MEIRRDFLALLKKRVEENRRFIQVIAGPRQIGKTTTVRQLLKEITMPFISITADNVASTDTSWINQQWEAARQKMKNANSSELLLVLDEIQKISNWSEAIKKNWDDDTSKKINIKLLLLGSSRLMLHQGLTESLAGRFELMQMTHWSFLEMQEAFDISEDEYAWFGAYPGAAPLINDEQRWKDYIINSIIEPSISKDILMLTRVDKPALLRKTFELGCIYSGQQLSFTKMQGQLQDAGNTTTLANYLQLLNSAGLLGGLQKYSGASIQTKNSSPKLQVYNNALISAYNGDGFAFNKNDPARWGRWIENIIGTHLINHSAVGTFELFYWRHVNYEVDFILKKGSKLIAIEVKSGHRLKSNGITAASKQFKFFKNFLIGIEGLHWKDFIKMDPIKLFE
jgi:predicted AAA+ superfamily ATPase